MLYTHLTYHNDSIIITDAWRKTPEDFFSNIFTSHFIARVRKGCLRFACERVLETEHKLHILTSTTYDRHVVSSLFSWCSTSGLGLTLSGVSKNPLGRVWLPYHIWSLTVWNSTGNCSGTLTQLNYIIIKRPHDRPLDLWNRMFNRHQAEITVMQFRGYSLPVHHCSGTMGLSRCPIS